MSDRSQSKQIQCDHGISYTAALAFLRAHKREMLDLKHAEGLGGPEAASLLYGRMLELDGGV